MTLLAPSIQSADIFKIEEAVRIVEESGGKLIHIDIMDGHFVPNLTFGPQFVSSLKEKTSLPLDVHLMVEKPRSFIPLFSEAGADWISIHIEVSDHLHRDITLIKELKKKVGLALNPATPIHLMSDIIRELDYVLLLTTDPGWDNQKFIESCHSKISQLKNWMTGQKLQIDLEVQGDINLDNMEKVIKQGADICVVGSALFESENPRATLSKMKEITKKGKQS